MRCVGTILLCSVVVLNGCGTAESDLPFIKDPSLSVRPVEISERCNVYETVLESEKVPLDSDNIVGTASDCRPLRGYGLYPDKTDKKAGKGTKKELSSVSLSDIEFDQDFTTARLVLAYSCGLMCGGTREFTLIKKNQRWVITDSRTLAVV